MEHLRAPQTALSQAFGQLLALRHPVAAWWWGETPLTGSLWPEWTQTAFQKEAEQWLALASQTVQAADPEVVQWGRFARDCHRRLQAGSWREGWRPLAHLELVARVLPVVDPEGHRWDRERLLRQIPPWLSRAETGVFGYWSQALLTLWSDAARAALKAWPKPANSASQRWVVARDLALQAIDRYCQRVQAQTLDAAPVMPWMAPAHVDQTAWRERRLRFPASAQSEPTADEGSGPASPEPAVTEFVECAGAEAWWLKPGRSRDRVFYREQTGTLALAPIWAIWRRESAAHPMTWALAQVPWIEGALAVVVEAACRRWPTWGPVRNGALDQWLRRRQALALADAWLWLEGGRSDDVLAFLTPWVGKAAALGWIPYLKMNPGRFVLSDRVSSVLRLQSAHSGVTVWQQGPLMPDALFRGDLP
jgi:hypothetical protein